ncbi:hypothetical protein CJF31_00002712 [Rutstroemia sp. NJR-2017a BVV2]|nr:hypothetical protein CJF31_00002712 [Rutstroemia sp. NJR-2017a BVV2]
MGENMDKEPMTSGFAEFTPADGGRGKRSSSVQLASHARLGLTVLGAISGLVIMATTADALRVYNDTHLGREYMLPIWPASFDLKPTVGMVACGTIIFVSSVVSLISMFIPTIKSQPNSVLSKVFAFLPGLISLVVAIVSTSLFYNLNASNATWSLKSWSCQWSNINTTSAPHWNTLCQESKAGIYLGIMIIPLEVYVCGLSAWIMYKEKRTVGQGWERKGSPDMS